MLVFGLIAVEQDEACLIYKREPVTERQYGINQRKRLRGQRRRTAFHVAFVLGLEQIWIAVHGAHGQPGKVFELVQRDSGIEMKGWTLAIEVGQFGSCVEA